jgi:antirestriction protein ArdC
VGQALVGDSRQQRANAATARPYSGCNVILLWMACAAAGYATPKSLTYKQA